MEQFGWSHLRASDVKRIRYFAKQEARHKCRQRKHRGTLRHASRGLCGTSIVHRIRS